MRCPSCKFISIAVIWTPESPGFPVVSNDLAIVICCAVDELRN